MNKKRVNIARYCLILLLVTCIFCPLGCAKEFPVNTIIHSDISEFSFNDFWNQVLLTTKVREESVKMFSFRLSAINGDIKSLYLNFYGEDEQGNTYSYFVNVNSLKELIWYSNEFTSENIALENVTTIFDEMDKLGFENICRANEAFELWINYHGGDILYEGNDAKIFLLSEGKLNELERIEFHTNSLWMNINVFIDGVPQTWFIDNDVDLASEVTYK